MTLSGICTAAFSILVGGANGIGASRLLDTGIENGTGFGVCSLPCWAGITPGVTTTADVIALLDLPAFTELPQTFNEGVFFTIESPTTNFEGIVRGDHRGIVNLIRLIGPLPIPYLFGQLGQPDCALYPDPSTSITVIWLREQITIRVILFPDLDGNIHPDGNAHFLDIHLSTTQCTQPETLPWLGFVPSWRYMRQLNDGR